MKKSLKRFERLENTTIAKALIVGTELKGSRRFHRLEVNDRKIEFTLEDTVAPQETAPAGKQYFFLCPYCGGQNDSNVEVCSFCKRQLKNQYISDYAGQTHLLKKCFCGAINLKERKNCWVCGRDFSLWGDSEVKESPENIITLNIDGKIYKSTDTNLPEGIVKLMETIRRDGYSEELINRWVSERNARIDETYAQAQGRLTQISWQMVMYSAAILLIMLIMAWEIRTCYFTTYR